MLVQVYSIFALSLKEGVQVADFKPHHARQRFHNTYVWCFLLTLALKSGLILQKATIGHLHGLPNSS